MELAALKGQLSLARVNLETSKRQMAVDEHLARESRKAYYRQEGKVLMLMDLIRLENKKLAVAKAVELHGTKNGQERR